jgi:hypothetical protein
MILLAKAGLKEPILQKIDMAQLNANTPYIPVYVKNSFLYRNISEELTYGYIFGVKSQLNRALAFHVQLENGAIFWSVPLTAIQGVKTSIENFDLTDLQMWDCQSNDIAVTKFAFLENRRVDVKTKNKGWISGLYCFTIDSYEGDPNYLPVGYSGFPDEKVYHLIQLSTGHFVAYPNNRLRWHNPDFIKPYDLESPPKYKPFQEVLSCENHDSTAANSEEYFYNFNKINDNGSNKVTSS